MTWTQIKSITISDIHLGNPANPAKYVVAGLDKKLTYEALSGIQVLYLPGDIFDRGLQVNNPDTPIIVSWIRRLLSRCGKLGIVVVVLEGTPLHDRLQSELFVAINDSAEDGYKCELYYIKEVDILFIEKFGINVLCIPDAKNTSDEVTYNQVIAMMKARAIEKVDFALIHGFFDFQVTFGGHSRFHDSAKYLAIVKYLIWTGHDHEFQMYDRIIIQGSPDRQRHGMEKPKGFVVCTVQRDGTYTAHFEENQYAMVFKTVTVDDDVDVARKQIYRACDSVVGNSHIRIAARRGHAAFSSFDQFQLAYPLLRFSKKILEEETVVPSATTIIDSEVSDYVPFTIDSSNIRVVIEERLSIVLLSPEEKAYFKELMDTITEGA